MGLPWIDNRRKPDSGPIDTGWREPGDRCPNCDWPTPAELPGGPDGSQVAMSSTPSSATFVCEHCGWTFSTERHGADNRSPRPGHQ